MRAPGFPTVFYRGAAICSALSAITTLLLIFLPELYAPAEGFEGRMLRVRDPAYLIRSWVAFVHPFLASYAAIAIALRHRHTQPALALAGAIAFGLWGFTEAFQQALTLAAFDPWRLAWIAGDSTVRNQMPTRTAIYDGIWDALYVLLLTAFVIGNAVYARLFWRSASAGRALGPLYLLASGLSIYFLFTSLGGASFLPASLVFWFYPLTQPLARLLIGWWLWKHADETEALPVSLRMQRR